MLTLAQVRMPGSPGLAWVAYVPFILVCSPESNSFRLCLVAYIVAVCFWLGNLYWISFVTVSGWVAFCLYTALLWPILAVCIRWCRNKGIPLVISVPVLVVGTEQMQGLFLGGFNWHYLAHSQYANTSLIQIADIFGAAGVSFLAAMVNGAVAEMLIARRLSFVVCRLLLAAAVLLGATGYGKWRINQSGEYITTGPMVGAVQTNVPQSVKQSFAAEEEIFDEVLGQSKQCAAAGTKLIIWPETMVQAILERQVLRLLESSHQYKEFDRAISEHAQTGPYVLVGAYGGSPRVDENFDIRLAEKYNSAYLYRPDGNQAPEKYAKIHLVPFGEYLPFESIPLVHNLFVKMSPYDFDYTLDAGREYTVFETADANTQRSYKFSVMICYEDAVPKMARRFALDENGDKRIDWLVNISNDGWFVRFKGGKVLPSTELAQHTAICAFRAVENRLAVVRSVNTGISCVIDSLGRIRNGYEAGNLPKDAFSRQGVGGWLADTIPIDSRTTIFSRWGQWLDFCCECIVVALIITQVRERLRLRKPGKNETTAKRK